jgi:hypothetical protein
MKRVKAGVVSTQKLHLVCPKDGADSPSGTEGTSEGDWHRYGNVGIEYKSSLFLLVLPLPLLLLLRLLPLPQPLLLLLPPQLLLLFLHLLPLLMLLPLMLL